MTIHFLCIIGPFNCQHFQRPLPVSASVTPVHPKVGAPEGNRARHLSFPQLDSRTTIKQYGLVRNRNLLGHDDNILPFSTKNRGELYICIFNFYFKITVSEAHCHIIDHWSSLEVAFCFLSILTSHGPGIHYTKMIYIKMYNIKHFNSERCKN